MLVVEARLARQLRVHVLVAILAVDRQEVARLEQVEHHALVFLGGVAGHVHAGLLAVDHLALRT